MVFCDHISKPTWPSFRKDTAEYIRSQLDDKVLVPMDWDTKRRAAMDVAGYCYRLAKGFLEEPEFYQVCAEMSVAQVG